MPSDETTPPVTKMNLVRLLSPAIGSSLTSSRPSATRGGAPLIPKHKERDSSAAADRGTSPLQILYRVHLD